MGGGVVVRRIVSGGQTGADRAALDWAVRHGVGYGGWCPRGGMAEDREEAPGLLAAYPGLRETPSERHAVRTSWNVRDSDATLVVVPPGYEPTGGTAYTIVEAERQGRPHLVADGTDPEGVRRWLAGLAESRADGLVLNVAGPRASLAPDVYGVCTRLLDAVVDAPG
jgi:hypothetical protein